MLPPFFFGGGVDLRTPFGFLLASFVHSSLASVSGFSLPVFFTALGKDQDSAPCYRTSICYDSRLPTDPLARSACIRSFVCSLHALQAPRLRSILISCTFRTEFGGKGALNGKCSARGPRKMSEAVAD